MKRVLDRPVAAPVVTVHWETEAPAPRRRLSPSAYLWLVGMAFFVVAAFARHEDVKGIALLAYGFGLIVSPAAGLAFGVEAIVGCFRGPGKRANDVAGLLVAVFATAIAMIAAVPLFGCGC